MKNTHKISKMLYEEGHADMSGPAANTGINEGRKIRHYSFLRTYMNRKSKFIYSFW